MDDVSLEFVLKTKTTDLIKLNDLRLISSEKLIFRTTFEFMENKDNILSPYSYPGIIIIKNIDLPEKNWKMLVLDSLEQKQVLIQINKLKKMKDIRLDIKKVLGDLTQFKDIYYILLFNEFGKTQKKRIAYSLQK